MDIDLRKNWYSLDRNLVETIFATSRSEGLSLGAATERRMKFGSNELSTEGKRKAITIFLGQFTDILIVILAVAVVVSGFLGEWLDAGAIFAIIILNGIMGFVQEYRAEKSLEALREMASPKATVVRDGVEAQIESSEIVPGDIVKVKQGDKIPCDIRLVDTRSLSVEEAALTGESIPRTKDAKSVHKDKTPLGDRTNMAYMGTSVTFGRGTGIAVATGMHTELGNIATLVSEIALEETPLQRRLVKLGKVLLWACLGIVTVVFVLGLLRSVPPTEMFLTSVSLAVAAIPEGLPAVVTIALALGVQRMVKRNALVRRLSSVETLGSTSVICSDKTGTLTQNMMRVVRMYVNGNEIEFDRGKYDERARNLLSAAVMNTSNFISAYEVQDASLEAVDSSPTQAAVITAGINAGIDFKALQRKYDYIDEVPFDSGRKRMTAVYESDDDDRLAIMMGAPEVIVKRCSSLNRDGREQKMTADILEELEQANAAMAGRGLRVLAVAERKLLRRTRIDADIEKKMTFLGYVAIADPPREEAYEAVRRCKIASIRPIMITGDHAATAASIAAELNIIEEGDRVLAGPELDELDDTAFEEAAKNVSVFARVTPRHKLRIVNALKGQGEVVAMTGDGVNDAPALKEADIGIAMGITGTDVSKEASDMVLTDDNFATIVSAVEEGRAIFDNLKKFIHFLLSCNAGELIVMLIATAFGMPLPLLPIQILWVNLITDGAPALALGVDPAVKGILNRPPRKRDAFLFELREGVLIPVQGLIIGLATIFAFYLSYYVFDEGLTAARTMAFSVLTLSQLFHALNCRSQDHSFFAIGPLKNKWLLLAVTLSFSIHMAVVYVPFLQPVFKTIPLNFQDWYIVLLISSAPFVIMEAYKLIRRLILKLRKDEEGYYGVFPR
ncbi:MAG: cation-translocating P-type ATPase [bacterium]|nr:cation-translocating P-type ATPase [bacterium]